MNTNAYRLGQLIVLEQNKIADAKAGIAYVKLALSFAFVTTWILYFIFAFSFYVADLWGISTWLTENTSELVAFTLFLTMALLMAQTLSMIKHAFYQHKAAFQYGLAAVLLICSLGVFMELFNSSSQQQTIAHQSAEKSKTFDSVANTQISIDGGANSSGRIAYLSGELAKAREYLNGCKKTCKTYQVKVADLTAQIEALQAGQVQANEIASLASTNAIKAKTEAMSALKEDAHKPVFKFIRDALGVGISTAVVIIACLVSMGFEYSHALLSRMLGEKLSYLESLQNGLVKLKTDYMQASGAEYGSSELIDAPELPASSFKYQQAAPFVSGFTSFKQPIPPVKTEKPSVSTFKAELEAAGVSMPYDPVLDKAADKASIQRIIGLSTHGNERVIHERVNTQDNAPTRQRTNALERGVCPMCGATFKPKNKWHVFCSNQCRYLHHEQQNPERKQFKKRGSE